MGIIMRQNIKLCIICQSPDSKQDTGTDVDGLEYSCPHCGKYFISTSLMHTLNDNDDLAWDFLHKAPALATEMKLKGIESFKLTEEDKRPFCNGHDLLNTFPVDFEDRLDRTMLNLLYYFKIPEEKQLWIAITTDSAIDFDKNLASRNQRFMQEMFFTPMTFMDHPLLDAGETLQAMYVVLKKSGYIKDVFKGQLTGIALTYEGWKYARDLQKKEDSRTTAFVAMWFHKTTNEYRKSTRKAIEAAGYEAVIIDEKPHNDFIMDKVINFIDEARFVIADFTCIPEEIGRDGKPLYGVRGGVYYEAGYAKGLKLEVIHTCNADSQPRMHFDIQQKNTIFWKEEEDGKITTNGQEYIEYLKEHIWATVGKRK